MPPALGGHLHNQSQSSIAFLIQSNAFLPFQLASGGHSNAHPAHSHAVPRCVHTIEGEYKAALRRIAEHFGNIVDFAIAVDVARQTGVASAGPGGFLGKAGVVEMR